MLTGRTPFIGDTPAEVMHKHLDANAAARRRVRLRLPDGARILWCATCCRKEPTDRPESAFVVAKRLDRPRRLGHPHTDAGLAAPTLLPRTRRSRHPRGSCARPLAAEALERSTRNKWLMPLICRRFGLSVALNFRSLETVQKNRAEELWFEAFKSDNAELRTDAAGRSGELAQTSPAAADTLVAALSDPRPAVRSSALDGLENSGPAARAATTALMRIQNTDDNDMVRRRAVELLKTIQASPEGVGASSVRSSLGASRSWWAWASPPLLSSQLRKPGRTVANQSLTAMCAARYIEN